MPGSEKILKNREYAANRAAGIGDKDGRLPAHVKSAEVVLRCKVCSADIRATKRNIEAGAHASSKHPTMTFQECFPGATLPDTRDKDKDGGGEKKKVDIDKVAQTKSIVEGGQSRGDKKMKKKKKEDLSFLSAMA